MALVNHSNNYNTPWANYIGNMLIPGEDPDGSERRKVADQPVVIYKPRRKKIEGLTFVITAANMPLSKYTSIINALTSVDHVVIGFFVNVLNPPLPRNHRVKAERVAQIFQELKDEFRVRRYNLVGHSIGGKIALLVAALYDEEHLIQSIIGLDPVDQSPVEFTNTRRGRANVSLESTQADITVSFTDTGYFVDKKHNAREIQKNNPSLKLVLHRNSYHMVYCDEGGLLSWKALMGRGKSADRNQAVMKETIQLIKERATPSQRHRASGAMKSTVVGKAKKSLKNGIADLREKGDEAQRKGSAYKGIVQAYKSLS